MLSNSSISSITIDSNFSMPLNLDSGGAGKDPFNISSSGYFDPPPPPGGFGNPFSPLFNQPGFDLVVYKMLDLNFFKKFEIVSAIIKSLGSWLSSKTQTNPATDSLDSKLRCSPLTKYDFTQLPKSTTHPSSSSSCSQTRLSSFSY